MAGIHKLTPAKAAALVRIPVEKPTVYSDGGGLYLRVRPNGVASWFYAAKVNGQRRELGLGSAASVSLANAREKAGVARAAVAAGRDPFAEHAASKAEQKAEREGRSEPTVVTFGRFADDYIASIEHGFRNPKHRAQWKSTIRRYAAPLREKPIADVGTDDVLEVLRPIWLAKPETASRVRGRIEKVLSAAKAKGLRPRDSFNPATWRGHLDLLLPKQPKLSRGHHAALPFADAPAFVAALRRRPATAARALEFTILTAARTGESIGALWSELDFKRSTWTVPAARMKAGAEHVVPLSPPALAVLEAVKPEKVDPRAFVFASGGKSLSNMAMTQLLKRMGFGHVTTHGMRSTFRDWCGDEADFPRELVEQALAHTITNKAEKAYRRGTAVEKRRELMQAWADYLAAAPEPVVEAAAPLAAANDEAPAAPAPKRRKRGEPNPWQVSLEL